MNLFSFAGNGMRLRPFNCLAVICSAVVLFLMSSCLKQDFPEIEDITKGSKWNLSIGDNYEEIYGKLQDLGVEKEFYSVAIVGRTTFEDTESIRDFLPYYHWLSFRNTEGRLNRVLIGLDSNRVQSLYAGNAMLDSLNQWPQNLQGDSTILLGASFDQMLNALEIIETLPDYRTYQFLLPDKPLDLPLDPDMKKFGQWYFTFNEGTDSPGKEGTSQVTLYFEDGRLARIQHVYNEYDVSG